MDPNVISKSIPVFMLLVLGVMEAMGGLYFDDKRTKNDWTIELVSLFTLPTLIQPAIFVFTIWLCQTWFPQFEDYFIGVGVVWHILVFLVLDDMTQYWWHRLSHSNRMMWKLHRPHHVVEEMGVLVTYRNAIPVSYTHLTLPTILLV